ncbi:hypothetical protein B0T22DRAFT_297570 [Podospora appendiculata]|uniref:Uncharacterized protein n=1 Tax=Podospora appendiculata TaxID=314037 RepID=A0AAE0X1S2_9PEZI|nr:hypothetical protein B0T22DRAFT_297570 [Podospora appendiculata]
MLSGLTSNHTPLPSVWSGSGPVWEREFIWSSWWVGGDGGVEPFFRNAPRSLVIIYHPITNTTHHNNLGFLAFPLPLVTASNPIFSDKIYTLLHRIIISIGKTARPESIEADMQPTTEEPIKQTPMGALEDVGAENVSVGDGPGGSAGGARVVSSQPRPEPMPKLENEMTLRGGRMNLGFSCCDGHCSFHKGCC